MMNGIIAGLYVGSFIVVCWAISAYFHTHNRIYRYPGVGWLDIHTHPIPDGCKNFLITDGKSVRNTYMPDYNKHGQMVMCCVTEEIVTHWMPYPDVPK